jgi:2-methylcitrate dehydratase
LLLGKFKAALGSHLPAHRVENIMNICHDPARFEAMPVHEFVEHFVL